ncbi:MAG: hypothetical protein BAJALOKI1v1_1530003 [Promethearchaeota archaeon]|nr:MAG: hypothetical protein BAJALOKI1v1_1530003 [Candidatus Lokiarchaeota archaeon]
MKKIEEIGECPKCGCALIMYRTSNKKRFAKCDCDECQTSYAVPKWGKIHSSALLCPVHNFPILIVQKSGTKAYFWTDRPCFTCTNYDKCEPIQSLEKEFTELEVYGF